MLCRALILVTVLTACGDDLGAPRILFIRGGSGTGGFVEGGADEHLSDIHDLSTAEYNHGYGQLAALLTDEGFRVEQVEEGPASDNTPVDLRELSRYAVVVFGSNNATYTSDDAARFAAYIAGGGGAMFSSDGNWGSFWDKAPSSDQTFLTQFGLLMNQDGGGRITLAGEDFVEPMHPILDGVDAFDGEGVSPCTLSHDPAAFTTPVRLVAAKTVVHRNTAPNGPVDAATADDASLAIAEYGRGRIACHYDRNTFFNENGAATSLHQVSNRTYARNLFAWLVGRI